jgi:hypothetical protein
MNPLGRIGRDSGGLRRIVILNPRHRRPKREHKSAEKEDGRSPFQGGQTKLTHPDTLEKITEITDFAAISRESHQSRRC